MNDSNTPPLPPPGYTPARKAPRATPHANPEPLPERASTWQLVDSVLRRPAALAEYGHRGSAELSKLAISLLATTVFALALFGFVVGTFSGHSQLWVAPVKLVAIGFFSGLLCLPSLYIFAALAGRELDLRGACGSMMAILARGSLLLLGFAPLAWLFAASTTSIAFYGAVIVFLGLVSTLVGLGFFASSKSGAGSGYLVLWAAVFMLVTLQMPTSLRPVVGTSENFLPQEKRFFLTHWAEVLSGKYEKAESTSALEEKKETDAGGLTRFGDSDDADAPAHEESVSGKPIDYGVAAAEETMMPSTAQDAKIAPEESETKEEESEEEEPGEEAVENQSASEGTNQGILPREFLDPSSGLTEETQAAPNESRSDSLETDENWQRNPND